MLAELRHRERVTVETPCSILASRRCFSMERRFVFFIVLAMLLLTVNAIVSRQLNPPQQVEPVQNAQELAKVEPKKAPTPSDKPSPPAEAAKPSVKEPDTKVQARPAEPPEKPLPEQLVALGSANPASPYRMLVTLTNRGAAVVRTELSSPKYRELENRAGYLGYLFIEGNELSTPCKVEVVGDGTPAQQAGLRAGDIIKSIDSVAINNPQSLLDYLDRKRAGQSVTLTVSRDGREVSLPVTLGRRPLEVLKPESNDPLSYQMTLARLDDEKLPLDEKVVDNSKELEGVKLRTGTWNVVESDQEHVVFRRELKSVGLEITKTYRMEKVPQEQLADSNYKAYHLVFDVSLRNTGDKAHKVAYQLDGPTGLPTEGFWYAYKSWTTWGAVGLRDVVLSYNERFPTLIACPTIADGQAPAPWNKPEPLTFIGVDAQYFSAEMIPQPENSGEVWFAQSQAMRAGSVNPDWKNTTNTTSRVVSVDYELKPKQDVKHRYLLFAGPKKLDLLAQYGLEDLVYYGWFWWAAKPMVRALHFFHAIVGNWGLAIIMLTALVRLCMFPLSRKQALGTAKMAELQPEIKKLQEKYKNSPNEKVKAQQDLFRKHNYNPLSGCLVAFIQLPIFVALYKSLGVDVELRQAPLIAEAVHWCSNLAAPDMLFNWSRWMPEFVVSKPGILGLGPYFNILPLITIVLFLWQQKKMMPPPADEQAAMQQKIMQYMMIFMGLMFFKVASGLCVYFIVSSLWGMGERKFLPKFVHPDAEGGAGSPAAQSAARPVADRDGSASRNKKKSRRPR
jgi:YidC/Oxa1 family membrane protein insertase